MPSMSDESVIVKGNGTIFLAGPPLVKAALGEVISAEELGGGEVHTTKSGVADHLAADEEAALRKVREIVAALPNDAVWGQERAAAVAVLLSYYLGGTR